MSVDKEHRHRLPFDEEETSVCGIERVEIELEEVHEEEAYKQEQVQLTPLEPIPQRSLTRREASNLALSLLAWACTIASVTLVVGTSNVVHLSIGGGSSLSSVPLATFFLGASLVSLTVTPWHFQRWGRKIGLLAGVGSGLFGTVFGILAVILHAPPLLIVSTAFFGAAMGIGFYLRFAAVELVPLHWADKAVTLVVTGGCIAAFAGPESAEGTRDIFGPQYLYLGVFLMTGVFAILNGVFVILVHFPAPSTTSVTPGRSSKELQGRVVLILRSRNFIVPMLIATLSWIIMALPMSVLRVAMAQIGFSSRQSLLAIELHFLGMYSPGFFTGQLIANYGPRSVALGAVPLFLIALACLQSAETAYILWIIGMVLIGIGWNCAFSGCTVGSTRSYFIHPACKSAIQAANDGLTFLLAGAVICTSSSMYQAGGGALPGWRTVNGVCFGFISLFALILGVDWWIDRLSSVAVPSANLWSSPSVKA